MVIVLSVMKMNKMKAAEFCISQKAFYKREVPFRLGLPVHIDNTTTLSNFCISVSRMQ